MAAEYSLTSDVCEFVNSRVRQGEITRHTGQNFWSSLMVLAKAHGRRPVGQINRHTLMKWRRMRSHLRPSSQVGQWSRVVVFLDWLVAEGKLTANPARGMKGPRRPRSQPRALETDAIAEVLNACPDARARSVIWLMVGMGLRCVEVSRLNVEDWARKDQVMRIVGKGGHERDVPVPAGARRALEAYLDEHPASSGSLIRSYRVENRPLRAATLSHLVSVWMSAAGVKHTARDGVSAHALRHTAASDVLEQCGDLRVVQQMLGHAHLSATSVYLRRAGLAQMRDAMEGRDYRPTVLAMRATPDDAA